MKSGIWNRTIQRGDTVQAETVTVELNVTSARYGIFTSDGKELFLGSASVTSGATSTLILPVVAATTTKTWPVQSAKHEIECVLSTGEIVTIVKGSFSVESACISNV